MEEAHIQSENLTTEDDQQEAAASKITGLSNKASDLQQIYRQGDKIHQIDDENVTMIKSGPPNVDTSHGSIEGDLNADEVQSGESLFKTFSFDNVISKEETEKCLEFWRSVVEKQLEPIKCTLIETALKNKEAEKKRESTSSSKKPKRSVQSKLKNEDEKPVISTTKIESWNAILLELQKKRLHRTKLMLEKRCRFCGYLSSPPYQTSSPQAEIKESIKELDSWQPTSRKKSIGSLNSSKRATSERRISKELQKNRNSSGSSNSKPETILEETMLAQQLEMEKHLLEVKEDSQKIKYVDAINIKKSQNKYGSWRANKLIPCECKKTGCDCHINDSVKGYKQHLAGSSSIHFASSKEKTFIRKSIERQDMSKEKTNVYTSSNEIAKKSEEVIDTKANLIAESTNDNLILDNNQKNIASKEPYTEVISIKEPLNKSSSKLLLKNSEENHKSLSISLSTEDTKSKRHRKLSVMVSCTCSDEECDCSNLLTLPEKPTIFKSDSELFKPRALSIQENTTERKSVVPRVNSLELIRTRLSSIRSIKINVDNESEDSLDITRTRGKGSVSSSSKNRTSFVSDKVKHASIDL
ncbi:uncharacterized protein LOC126745532 isoform X2 [Anthonomus grandis grandis]|uniref:uncharacterized protein LOC126745532 isoform X2 n=1 Tax=Anthonomus grandis grandis TaxID=2921223 RepID=UPI002165CE0E|nr:uncharacterized protein LOC126745532 isoform X2 [Anthonomus grandis grandis]